MGGFYQKYTRKNSIRLQDYDYSTEGLYFLTIDVQYMLLLFGEIRNKEMILYPSGDMIYKWYAELENKFPHVKCHAAIVMPNHFHCIIEIVVTHVPDVTYLTGVHVGTPLRGCPCNAQHPHNKPTPGIPKIMEWFKTMTTNAYIRGVKQYHWPRFNKKLWQRSYYDHIIRDQRAYDNIHNYILTNPANWKGDKFYQHGG